MPDRSPYVLAALASAAVARLEPCLVSVAKVPGDFDAAVVVTNAGDRVEVRVPRTASAEAELNAELALLRELRQQRERGSLPFDVPHILGTAVEAPDLAPGAERGLDGAEADLVGQAVVQRPLPGQVLDLDTLAQSPDLAGSLGQAIAAIHKLPPGVIERSGGSTYSADEYQQRLLTEIDDAALSGKVPPVLLKRWEEKMADEAFWRFQPVVVHGDLDAELIRTSRDKVVVISGWSHAQVSDPADDLVWLFAAAPESTLEAISTAYRAARGEAADSTLFERARLGGELALARWLRHGIVNSLPSVVAEAEAMLQDLAQQVE